MSLSQAARKLIRKAGLNRLLRKLASAQYRRECALARDLISEIQGLGFQGIVAKHGASLDDSHKYMNLDWHLEEVVHAAGDLGLLQGCRRRRVLDLGCGSGCFLFVLKRAGHDVLGLDLSDTVFYNDMVGMLGVPRLAHRIEAFTPLPDTGRPFDLITAYSICFDLHHTEHVWGPEQWSFFIDDCRSRLRPGGRLFLNFNPATTRDFDFIPDPVADLLRDLPGGHLTESKEFFTLSCASGSISPSS